MAKLIKKMSIPKSPAWSASSLPGLLAQRQDLLGEQIYEYTSYLVEIFSLDACPGIHNALTDSPVRVARSRAPAVFALFFVKPQNQDEFEGSIPLTIEC